VSAVSVADVFAASVRLIIIKFPLGRTQALRQGMK